MTLEEAQQRIRELESLVAVLTQQVDYLKRQIYGQKSERFEHPELFEGEAGKSPASSGNEPVPEEAAEGAGPREKGPKKHRPIRAERLRENLPVRGEVVIVPREVEADPEAWRKIGEEVAMQVEREPGYFYLRRIVRQKFVRVDQPFLPPVIAPAPATIVEGGFWGPGLIAEILANRYLDHLPYYRQEARYLRNEGVHLSRKTMSDYAERVAELAQPLVARMKAEILLGGYVRADETWVRYLDRMHPKGIARGFFWAYRGAGPDVIFDWRTSREHRHLADWLGYDYEGVLQSDGYEAYARWCREMVRRGKKVTRAACLAHIRRKFEAALEERPQTVAWILKIIRQLYGIEDPFREAPLDVEARARIRQGRSRRWIDLLERAFKYLLTTRILPKSRLGKALQYALAQWPAMRTYLDHGYVEIDTNLLENDIRPSAVGKKNWLFIGSPEAGRRSATLYSLLLSARNHGVDPRAYLRDVIEKLPGRSANDIDDLLPANWAAANRERCPLRVPPRRAA